MPGRNTFKAALRNVQIRMADNPRGIFILMNSHAYNALPLVLEHENGINKPIQKVKGQFNLAQWLIFVSHNTHGANIKVEEAFNSSGKQIFWQQPFSVQ